MSEDKCYVYIIGTNNGAFKIGVAADPWDRYDNLRPGIPDPSAILMLIACRTGKHAFAVERGIHRELDQYRSVGEWFRPPKSVLGELILELSTKIDAFAAEIPTIEYPLEPPSFEIESDIIALRTTRSTRDRSRIVYEIIKDNSPATKDLVLEEAEQLGLCREKTSEILDRLRRDGTIFEPKPGIVKVL